MTTLRRVRVTISGLKVVGAGVATFYTAGDASALTSALRDFYSTIATTTPSGVSFDFPMSGEELDSATGNLLGTWTGPARATVTGTNAGTFTLGVGGRVTWLTAGTVRNRRVRGTTYLVPLAHGAYDTSGLLTPDTASYFEGAAAALSSVSGAALDIWSRPIPATVGGPPAAAGQANEVTGVLVSRQVSWLRTRRT